MIAGGVQSALYTVPTKHKNANRIDSDLDAVGIPLYRRNTKMLIALNPISCGGHTIAESSDRKK
jgi:hypothetical protein